jgi:hypothetical protein
LAAPARTGKAAPSLRLEVLVAGGGSDVVTLTGFGFAKNSPIAWAGDVQLDAPVATDGSGAFVVTATLRCPAVKATDDHRNAAAAYDDNLTPCG